MTKIDFMEMLANERNKEVESINKRISELQGRIVGIDFMICRIAEYFNEQTDGGPLTSYTRAEEESEEEE